MVNQGGYRQFQRPSPDARCVLTIGNFDGVHIGHRRILSLALERARALGLPAYAYTFRPHPRALLYPNQPIEFLTTYDEKLELLSSLGLDGVIEEPFTAEFSRMTAHEFFEQAVVGALGASEVVVGYDFGFGRARSGHLEELSEFCKGAGVKLDVVPALRDARGEVASSSRIRALLHAGEVAQAGDLLARPFFYRGPVVQGDQRGRKIGFPTANLRIEGGKLLLPFGVYATRTLIDGRAHASVTNLGVRPTFEASAPSPVVETHVLNFSGDLYGRQIEVSFIQRLREERKFSGIDELKAQIARDSEGARAVLS